MRLFQNNVPEPYENYLRRVAPFLLAAATAAAAPAAAQQAPTKPTFQVAIEQQLGAETVQRIMFGAQIEQLSAALKERDKTIEDLRAQLAEAKKEPPK